jgi:hypothetical protein
LNQDQLPTTSTNNIPHVTALCAIAISSGCSGLKQGLQDELKERLSQKDYKETIKENYLASCLSNAVKNATTQAARKYCECKYGKISSNIPASEFVKLGINKTKFKTRTSLDVAIAQCGENTNSL